LSEYDVTLSLPVIIGRKGVVRVLRPRLSEQERAALERSALTMKQAIAGLSN
jgi:malate/lactate dehydrogenase